MSQKHLRAETLLGLSLLDSGQHMYHRSVLTLIDLYELDYREAAEALKVPIGTIKSRLARARTRMKEKLENGLSYPDGLQFAAANCG